MTETAYPGDVIRVCLEEAQTASAHLENYNFKIGSKTQAGLNCDKAFQFQFPSFSFSWILYMKIQIFWQLINRREWLRIPTGIHYARQSLQSCCRLLSREK